MIKPESFKSSLKEAEAHAYRILCEVLLLRDGTDAHIGINPGKENVFVFTLGNMDNGQVLHSGRCEHFHFIGTGEVWHGERDKVQEFVMGLVGAMPIDDKRLTNTNLATFRLRADSVKSPDQVVIEVEGEKEPLPCWHTTFDFDVVFYTGPRLTLRP